MRQTGYEKLAGDISKTSEAVTAFFCSSPYPLPHHQNVQGKYTKKIQIGLVEMKIFSVTGR